MLKIFSTFAVAAIALSAFSAPASAAMCGSDVSAEGRATRVEGSDDFRKYNGHVPIDLARTRAISAWQGKIGETCPRYSANWQKARGPRINCDAGMGHEWCVATAAPRLKISSWFLPR